MKVLNKITGHCSIEAICQLTYLLLATRKQKWKQTKFRILQLFANESQHPGRWSIISLDSIQQKYSNFSLQSNVINSEFWGRFTGICKRAELGPEWKQFESKLQLV